MLGYNNFLQEKRCEHHCYKGQRIAGLLVVFWGCIMTAFKCLSHMAHCLGYECSIAFLNSWTGWLILRMAVNAPVLNASIVL